MKSIKKLQTKISEVPVIDFEKRLPKAPKKTAPVIDVMAAQMDAGIEDIAESRGSVEQVHKLPEPVVHTPQRTWKQYFADRDAGIISDKWNEEIKKLEDALGSLDLPKTFRNISNVSLFIAGHLAMIKNYNGNPRFKPYLERLIRFKNAVSHTH